MLFRRPTQPPLSPSTRRCVSFLLLGAVLLGASARAEKTTTALDSPPVDKQTSASPDSSVPDSAASLKALAWPDGDQVARVSFTEERQFPFRRFPKRFSGTLDRSPEGELILAYTQPNRERLLLLKDGIYFEDSEGQRRKLPAEAGYVRVLRDLIGGDQEALRQDWRTEPRPDGFALYPKSPQMDRALKRVEVTVDEGRVRTVQVFLSDGVERRYSFGPLSWVPPAQFGQPPPQP